MEDRYEQLIMELEREKAINKALRRELKKAACQDQNIQPKKEHTGYVVLKSVESAMRVAGTKLDEYEVWQTTIQTPYTVNIPENMVREYAYAELVPDLIRRIGIEDVLEMSLKDYVLSPAYESDNISHRFHLQAAYRTGYWSVILRHSNPLTAVPDDMRIRKKGRRK